MHLVACKRIYRPTEGRFVPFRAVATRKGHESYPQQLSRHWQAAKDGSLIVYWANWNQWTPSKVISNLKCVAHLYDSHRLEPQLFDAIGANISAAVYTNVSAWNNQQRSRVLLVLSRLMLVPDSELWALLVSGLLIQPQTNANDQYFTTSNSSEPLARVNSTVRGVTGRRHRKRRPGQTNRKKQPNEHGKRMARVGLLYSVSVMHMLASGSGSGIWETKTFGCLEHHLIPEKLPPGALSDAVESWKAVSKHAPEIDGVWLPISGERESRHSSSLEKSVVRALQDELCVPVLQEAVLEGSYVAVDVAIVGKRRAARKCVFVAVEIQGPHHFVTRRQKEKRSSKVKRLLRQHAGWHVVPLSHAEWGKTRLESRRLLLRQKLSILPQHCWKHRANI